MSILNTAINTLGKLVFVGILAAAFLVGLAGVVYMSLSGKELTVPQIIGKDYVESERELAALGLKIKRRADRPSTEKINTVLEQLPKAGETVKTGQMILVVVSRAGQANEETPAPINQNSANDDSKKIEEMITDKPKKPKSNSNANSVKKKPDSSKDANANSADGELPLGSPPGKSDLNKASPANVKPLKTPLTDKLSVPKPAPDTRRRIAEKP